MVDLAEIEPGAERSYSRTFTREDVERFADLSHDEGYHHLVADSDGTVLVHGLLTATLPTKIGGDIDYLARTMQFEFPRPAYTGREITCELTVDSLEEREDRYDLAASFACTTPDGEVVMRGETDGVVLKHRVD
ncbi:MAG: dehydratase [Halobacteriales archaeon]|nr:dehydratase [Halobacteriales archaeon]